MSRQGATAAGAGVAWLARLALAAALAVALASSIRAEEAVDRCQVPPDVMRVNAPLPRTAQRIKAGANVTIVALGGASTRGVAASSPAASYPERLMRVLSERFPKAQFTVINRGMPRQSARQMLERMPWDAIQAEPDLVIWEVGVHDAAQSLDVDDFALALQSGIDLMRARNIDPMLIDMQYGRLTSGVINFEPYLDSLHRVADANGVLVFPRYEIMKSWAESGAFDNGQATGPKRAELAGQIYDCMARQLATLIQLAIE